MVLINIEDVFKKTLEKYIIYRIHTQLRSIRISLEDTLTINYKLELDEKIMCIIRDLLYRIAEYPSIKEAIQDKTNLIIKSLSDCNFTNVSTDEKLDKLIDIIFETISEYSEKVPDAIKNYKEFNTLGA